MKPRHYDAGFELTLFKRFAKINIGEGEFFFGYPESFLLFSSWNKKFKTTLHC